ncbi:MAG TPA: MMPL family transporter, partial [Ktedonobacteraceae bacterium]|nr:MMPL family transporter [Ktedonobacteraceae bacterium]
MQIQERSQENLGKPAGSKPASSLESHGLYRLGLHYGRQVYRFRWLIIAFWVVVVIVSIPFAAKVGDVLQGGGYSYHNSESTRAENLISEKLNQPAAQLLVVFQSAHTPVNDPSFQKEVNDFMSRARSFAHVTDVSQGDIGQDGRTTYVTVNFTIHAGTVEDRLDDFRKLLPGGPAAGPAQAYLTGNPPLDHDFTQITQQDTEHAEFFALPLALLVLLVVFGTLVAAATPILLAVVAVPVTLAVIYAIGQHMTMSIFVLNIASIIGLGISIDYSLFMTRRFRDELAQGRSTCDAVGWTVATAGESILFSGLIVMIGFSGLLLIGVDLMTSLGIGGAVVVGTAVLAALTLLPALLGVLGQRINALRIPYLSRLTMRTQRTGMGEESQKERQGFWQRWALGVMKRPVLIILLVTVLLVVLGWPIFSISLGTTNYTAVPNSSEARQGMDILNAQFREINESPIYVVAQAPGGTSMLHANNLAKLDNLSKWIAAQAHVTGVISLTQLPATPAGAPTLSEQRLATLYSTGAYQHNAALAQLVSSTTNGNTTVITVTTNTKVDSSEGKALVNNLRAGDKAAGQGLTALIGGDQADSLDFNGYLYGNFPRAIVFILVATYILLLLMFRSVLLPLKAVLMNILSVSACLGVLVFIFQWGNFSNILGFTSDGFLDSIAPILLFCILFGLSMDYEVFLLSRIREEWLRTHNNRWAVAYGLEKTGGVITNAALLFVIVAGAFTFTS